jgi:hypothetical protein
MLSEIWKNITDCESYMVSNYGNIVSYKIQNTTTLRDAPKLLKQEVITTHCGKKYKRVKILGKSHYVHRLVAEAFIENPENKPQVNHLDGNSQNNIASNLEWATNSENQIHRFKLNGTKNSLGQYIHKNRSSYRVYKKGVIDKCFKDFETAKQFAKSYY